MGIDREIDLRPLRGIDSATVANALDRLDSTADAVPYEYSSLELRCMIANLPPMVGYAITCTGDSTSPRGFWSSPRNVGVSSRIRELYESVRDSVQPVVVVCQDIGSERLKSNHFGDIMATTLLRLGAVGAATDGGIRDLDGIRDRAAGFQMFAAGIVPAGGVARIVDVDVKVSICGMTIAPGDLLHGDINGLISIPRTIATAVADLGRQILIAEEHKISTIKSPQFKLEDLYPPAMRRV